MNEKNKQIHKKYIKLHTTIGANVRQFLPCQP